MVMYVFCTDSQPCPLRNGATGCLTGHPRWPTQQLVFFLLGSKSPCRIQLTHLSVNYLSYLRRFGELSWAWVILVPVPPTSLLQHLAWPNPRNTCLPRCATGQPIMHPVMQTDSGCNWAAHPHGTYILLVPIYCMHWSSSCIDNYSHKKFTMSHTCCRPALER